MIGSQSKYYNKLQYNTYSTSHSRRVPSTVASHNVRVPSRVRVIGLQGLRLESQLPLLSHLPLLSIYCTTTTATVPLLYCTAIVTTATTSTTATTLTPTMHCSWYTVRPLLPQCHYCTAAIVPNATTSTTATTLTPATALDRHCTDTTITSSTGITANTNIHKLHTSFCPWFVTNVKRSRSNWVTMTPLCKLTWLLTF